MIKIKDLNIHLGKFNLHDINLSIEKNQFFVLMGPTGAGKTVLLEAMVGLVSVKSGRITIGDRDITSLPPEKRGVSIVYQDYALFPHLNVEKNVTYGVGFHKIDKIQAAKRFDRLTRQLNLSHLLRRYPITLSGGELQRVALARALMVDPKVILLDEPLSALDPTFREEVRHLLKKLHDSSDVTFLMVTHDFAEALSLATQAAIMDNGKIEQVGSIQDIFLRPCSSLVADFVGMKNVFPATFNGTKALASNLEFEIARKPTNSHGYIAIRPEDIVISNKRFTSSMRNSFRGIVTGMFDQGFSYEVHINVGDITFKSLITKGSLFELGIHEGVEIFLSFKATAVHNF